MHGSHLLATNSLCLFEWLKTSHGCFDQLKTRRTDEFIKTSGGTTEIIERLKLLDSSLFFFFHNCLCQKLRPMYKPILAFNIFTSNERVYISAELPKIAIIMLFFNPADFPSITVYGR